MAVSVLIPTPLRKFTNDQETVQVEAGTVTALISALEQQFPGIAARLTDEQGKLRRFVNLYVNEEDIRFLSAEETELKDGDTVSIVPAIAGG